MVWSLDGQRLAYLKFRETPGNFETAIETRDLEGGAPIPIASRNGILSLYWMPDDRLIFSQQEARPKHLQPVATSEMPQWSGEWALERLTNWTGLCAVESRRRPTASASPL